MTYTEIDTGKVYTLAFVSACNDAPDMADEYVDDMVQAVQRAGYDARVTYADESDAFGDCTTLSRADGNDAQGLARYSVVTLPNARLASRYVRSDAGQ